MTPVITRRATPPVTPDPETVATTPVEPDLIDRIALALPEEIRAEYYRELLHCRSLPESDEMLRLLRAMQFLVLLIEQAPSRMAEERAQLDKLLASTIANISKINAASETHHTALQRKITRLPADIANGISPEAIAGKINEDLKREFERSTIPKTAESLAVISDRMKTVCTEFSATSDTLGNVYRGAAEEARKAIASLDSEMSRATATAGRFTTELSEKFSKVYRMSLVMLASGALVIGMSLGMMLERFLFSPPVIQQVIQPAQQPAPQPPAAPKSTSAK